MTTTKNKTMQQAEQARQHLAEARAVESRRKIELAEAEEAVSAIEGNWARGDETIPASALTTARDAATRAAGLLAAATREAKKAERGLINDDPSLAAAVVHALGGKFNGVPVHAVTVEPSIPNAKDRPVAYVIHTEVGGAMTGDVAFVVYGPEWMNKPDAEALTTQLWEGGTNTGRYGRTPRFEHTAHGDVHEHRIDLHVTSAQPALPYWPDARERAPHAIASLARSLGDYIHTKTSARTGVVYPFPIASRLCGPGTVTRSKPSGVGTTDTAVVFEMDFRAHGIATRTAAAAAEVRAEVAQAVSHLTAQWAKAGGRTPHIQSVAVTRTEAGAQHTIPTKVELVLRSRDAALTLADVQ